MNLLTAEQKERTLELMKEGNKSKVLLHLINSICQETYTTEEKKIFFASFSLGFSACTEVSEYFLKEKVGKK